MCAGNLDTDQAIVLGSGIDDKRRSRIRCHDFWHVRRVARSDPFPRVGKRRERRRLDMDCPRAPLCSQMVIPGKGGPGFKFEDIARPHGVEGPLQIPTALHPEPSALGGRYVARVDKGTRRLGLCFTAKGGCGWPCGRAVDPWVRRGVVPPFIRDLDHARDPFQGFVLGAGRAPARRGCEEAKTQE